MSRLSGPEIGHMPNWKEVIREQLAGLRLAPEREAEIVEELAQHLEDRCRELRAGGVTEEEAYRAALAELSASHSLAQELQLADRSAVSEPVTPGAVTMNMFEGLRQDLRYGARMLLKTPGFTLAAVIMLALGIGATTVIFSVVNAVLLRPLQFKEADRLVWFWGVQPMLPQTALSPADFLDYQAQNNSFDQIAAYRNLSFTLTGQGQPERIDGRIVSANYFSLLGVGAAIGRALAPEDGRAGAARVAILSYGSWRKRFNDDPNAVGKTLTLNGEPTTVIGIMPPDFTEIDVELWTNPRQTVPDVSTTSREDILSLRANNYLRVIGRLRPRVTLDHAQVDIDAIAGRLQQQYPQTNTARGVRLVSLHDRVVGDIRPTLLVLLGAVALLLLIATANIANLMTVRAMARAKETATRLALGASVWRMIRQYLTESALVACLGGLCGWLFALWGVGILVALSPAGTPRLSEARLDHGIFGFTLTISLLTCIVFGLFPALVASRTDLNLALNEHARGSTSNARRIRSRGALVIAQVALALVVLCGAGLLINSFARLQSVAPGFDPTGLTTMLIWLSDDKYVENPPRVAFLKELTRRLNVLPGVQDIAVSNDLPIRGTDAFNSPIVEGRPVPPPAEMILMGIHLVGPGFFRTMGIPMLRGRELTEGDDNRAPLVMVINETAARMLWPGEDAIGKRLKFGANSNLWIEIVGIVGDVKHDGLQEEAGPHAYASHLQNSWPTIRVAVRSQLEPTAVAAAVRSEVQAIDPTQPVSDVWTMDEMMSHSVAPRRFALILFSVFAGIALLLAAMGIYGVVSYSVSQRTHEISIRIALGAQNRDVLKLVIGQGMEPAVIGLAIGLILALVLTRLMARLLFHVSATDPVTFITVGTLLAGVALLACWLPARRANADPIVALRSE